MGNDKGAIGEKVLRSYGSLQEASSPTGCPREFASARLYRYKISADMHDECSIQMTSNKSRKGPVAKSLGILKHSENGEDTALLSGTPQA